MVAHTRSWWVKQTQPTYKIASGIIILDVDNWIIRLGNAAQCQFPGICSPHFALSTTGLIYGGGAHSHDAVGEMVCDYLRAIHNGVGEVTLCKNSVIQQCPLSCGIIATIVCDRCVYMAT